MYRWDNVFSFGDIICNTANSKLKREHLRRYIFERKELLNEIVSAYSLLKKYSEKYNYNIKKLMKNKTLSEFIDIAEKIRKENDDDTEFIHSFEFDENEEKEKTIEKNTVYEGKYSVDVEDITSIFHFILSDEFKSYSEKI
mgnify:CR=1 FL=1